MDNSVWCFVGGWPYLLHKAHADPDPELGIRPMTNAEVEVMRRIGVTAKAIIIKEVERQQKG